MIYKGTQSCMYIFIHNECFIRFCFCNALMRGHCTQLSRAEQCLTVTIYDHSAICEGGHTHFFSSPQIANPQILGLIPQLKIRKFLKCASPQIANPQIATFAKKIADLRFAELICGPPTMDVHMYCIVMYTVHWKEKFWLYSTEPLQKLVQKSSTLFSNTIRFYDSTVHLYILCIRHPEFT